MVVGKLPHIDSSNIGLQNTDIFNNRRWKSKDIINANFQVCLYYTFTIYQIELNMSLHSIFLCSI